MEINVTGKIYWLGVNDRRKTLFENLWPLPDGVSYNSYLIKDEKTALLDTVEMGSGADYIQCIEKILDGSDLDYLIINHMELDHSGEIGNIRRRWPNVKIVGNSKTFKILEAYYGITDNLREVKEEDVIDLGYHKLKFVLTPWVHWPETMMTYDQTDGVLFSADAFGTFGTLDGGVFDDQIDFDKYLDEMRRYYSNIVGKYSGMVQKAFAKLAGTDIKLICPLHGPIWRSDPAKVIGLYNQWSLQQPESEGVVIIYATMYGNNQRVADHIARKLSEAGIRDIKVHDVSKTHISYLINDIWKYRGVMLGSCAYNSQMFPLMENLTREIERIGLRNRLLGVFGTFSWSGGGVRNLQSFAEKVEWELLGPVAEIMGAPSSEKLTDCDALAAKMAAKILQK